MKLLVVSHPCATAVNQLLYGEIARQTGWEVSIVLPSNWRNDYGGLCPVERSPGFDGELIPIPVRNSGNIILHTYRGGFTRLIRDVNPDAIYVNHEPYAAATAQVYWGNARVGGRPIGFYSAQNISKSYLPPFRWTERWVLRSSKFAFPVSSAVGDVLTRKGYRQRMTVLPLAIDPGVYHRSDDVEEIRRELFGVDVGSNVAVLGYVGRLVPEKGLATLLAASALIRDLPWQLVMVGAGPMEPELKRLIAAAGLIDRIRFTGFVPHLRAPRLLSAFDLLVLPSETQSNWREQFGRVLLEAMACGTPVVGSDSGEIPVLIRDTGGGLTFRERNAVELAAALRRMIVEPDFRKRSAAEGKSSVTTRYGIRNVAGAFVEAVRAAAGNPRREDITTEKIQTSSIS